MERVIIFTVILIFALLAGFFLFLKQRELPSDDKKLQEELKRPAKTEEIKIHTENNKKDIEIKMGENSLYPVLKKATDGLRERGIDCSFENSFDTRNSFTIHPEITNILYLGIEGKGVFVSKDGGASWKPSSNGILAYPDMTNLKKKCYPDLAKIIIDKKNPNRLLLAPADVSSGYIDWPYAETAGIWESNDGGESWHQILKKNLNSAGTGTIGIDHTNSNVIYYGVNSDPPTFKEAPIKEALNKRGVLYKTSDGGKSWEELPTGMLPGLQGTGIFINPDNTNEILLLTQSHDHIYGKNFIKEVFLYEQFGPMKSYDGGKTWTKLAENLPSPFRAIFDGDVAEKNFQHIILRPFLFGDKFPSNVLQKSFYSLEGGKSFKETSAYIQVGRFNPHDNTGNHILGYSPWNAAGDIVESKDGGATWNAIGKPKEIDNVKVRISNFVWDPKTENIVYMTGTQGYTWKSTDGGKNWVKLLDVSMLY